MKKTFTSIALLSCMLLGTMATAQEKTSELSKDDDVITNFQNLISGMPKISGYLQSGYIWNDANAGDNSSFQVKRMRLFIDKKLSNTFEFKTQFELFSSSVDGTPYSKKVMTVMDAFMNVKLNKNFNLRLGQFYQPLGFENFDTSPSSLETIDFSNICYRMVTRNAVSSPDKIDYGRDLGILAYGDLLYNEKENFNYLSYQISLTNGQLATLNDDNKSKDIAARLTVRPIKNLRLMGSYNWGEYPNKVSKYNQMNRYIVGAWYNDPEGLSVRSEYGHIESSEANVDEDGLYATATYNLGKVSPVLKYDRYRDNINETSPVNKDLYVAGVNYLVNNNVKLQLNYIHSVYTDKVKEVGNKDGDGNGIQAMCVLKF